MDSNSENTKITTQLSSKYLGADLVELINGPTLSDLIENRPVRGGGSADYVNGYNFIKKLNELFGFLWNFKVKSHFKIDDYIVVEGQLSVKLPSSSKVIDRTDGTRETITFAGLEIIKEQFGGSELKRFANDQKDKSGKVTHPKGSVIDWSNDYKTASTACLKKCALSLGLFMDVYSVRGGSEEGVTTKQLETLLKKGKEAGMDEEKIKDWVKEQVGKELKDCEPLEVLGLLPKLKKLKIKE